MQETGIYDVDVYYITLYERAMTIVNGIVAFSESFEPSGPWCFDGGSPAIKTLQMRLEKGANLLEFRPTGAEAPIIDKIVVREPAHGDAEAVVKVSGNAREFDDEPTIASTALSETEESEVYPNPVRAGEQLTIRIPGLDIEGIPIKLQMTDISGKTMFTEEVTPETRSIPLEIRLNKGLYIVSIRIGSRTYYRRVEVD